MLFGLNTLTVDSEHTIFASTYSAALLSNGLACTGTIYYFYMMFRGYGVLPFVRKPQRLLMIVPFLMAGLFCLTMIKVNSWNLLLKFTLI